jgi:hypothetical protein
MSQRSLKRPCNHPLSTDHCTYQASEEEKINAGNDFAHCANLLSASSVTVVPAPYTKLTFDVSNSRRGLCASMMRFQQHNP